MRSLRAAGFSLLALAGAAGCSGDGGGGSNRGTLTAASSEVFLGEYVDVTLTVEDPAGPTGIAAWIEASNSAPLDLPPFVVIPRDETEVTVAVRARAAGGPVTVTAKVGGTPTVQIAVLPIPAITLIAVTTSADQLSNGILSWSGSATHARALDPERVRVTVPSTSGIALGEPVLTGSAAAFTLEVEYEVDVAAETGIVEIDVDTNGDDLGGSSTETLSIRRIPRISALTPASDTVDTTELRPFLLTLDQPARNGGETVTLISGNATIADPGSSAYVAAGETSAAVLVEGVAVGGPVSIVAALADSADTSTVSVADATITVPVVTAGGSSFEGQTVTLTATGTGSSQVAVVGTAFTLTAPSGSGLTLANEALSGSEAGWTLTVDVTVGAALLGTVNLALDANGPAIPGAARDVPFLVVAEDQTGDVIITELVTLTTNTANNAGEAVEIRNVSSGPIAVNAWTLETSGDGPFSIRDASTPGDDTTALILTAGQIAWGVPNDGVIPPGADFVWGPVGTTAQIGNAGDTLRLRDAGAALQDLVDFRAFVKDPSVFPGAADFPAFSQKSTQLDAASPATAAANDGGSAWCVTFRVADSLGIANQPCVSTVINEVLYDALGSPDNGNTFIELAGAGGSLLTGHLVRPVKENGATSQSTFTAATIPAGRRMPVDGLYVLADLNGAATGVANADQTQDSLDPEQGPGDSVQLVLDLGAGRVLLDVVRYGANAMSITVDNDDGLAAVETTHEAVVGAAGTSIGRNGSSTDTGHNANDFVPYTAPSPGAQN